MFRKFKAREAGVKISWCFEIWSAVDSPVIFQDNNDNRYFRDFLWDIEMVSEDIYVKLIPAVTLYIVTFFMNSQTFIY